MAQRRCPECGRMVSSYANNCQFCGYVIDDFDRQRWIEEDKKERRNRRIKRLLSIIGFIFFFYAIFINDKKTNTTHNSTNSKDKDTTTFTENFIYETEIGNVDTSNSIYDIAIDTEEYTPITTEEYSTEETVSDKINTEELEDISSLESLYTQETNLPIYATNVTANSYINTEETTTKARKTKMIGISGILRTNNTDNLGLKTIYVKIVSSSNLTINGNQKKTVKCDGFTTLYSERARISFYNEEKKFEIFYNISQYDKFEAGTYTISLICDDKEIGNTKLTLK